MKTAIITGASAGIGLATAKQLIKQDWQVINLSRRPCPIAGVKHITLDLGDERAITQLPWPELLQQPQTIALIHNAAFYHSDSIDTIDSDSLDKNYAVNIKAPILLNQQLLQWMQPTSSIIYVGSTLSEKGVPHAASYSISKHAVLGMMRATCQDLAGRGIHTVCVCPGATDTEMLQTHAQHNPGLLEHLQQMNTQGRLATPAEIATVIQHATDNPVLNGTVIHANLGQLSQ